LPFPFKVIDLLGFGVFDSTTGGMFIGETGETSPLGRILIVGKLVAPYL